VTTSDPTADPTADPTRRGLLTTGAAAVAAAAGFVAMRARDDDRAPEEGASTDYASGAAGTVVALSDLPAGTGVVLQAEQVVVTRDDQGEVRAFSAVCTHQRCLVSGVVDGGISCPCHGSVFDAVTGAVVRGPAPAPLPPVPVSVDGDDVVVG
jgi:Rieske Fe-S protein